MIISFHKFSKKIFKNDKPNDNRMDTKDNEKLGNFVISSFTGIVQGVFLSAPLFDQP